MSKNYWLMKSEPDVYSIDQMKKDGKTLWTGVRNYQARNFMMLEKPEPKMKVGDLAFFYHSNATPPGIAGLVEITRLSIADPTQFDKKSEYFDEKSKKEAPIWHCAEVKFVEKFERFLSLDEIRQIKECAKMILLQKGSRLSITPVTAGEAKALLSAIQGLK